MSELKEQMMEKIDRYLTGNLSPIESTQFESEIATNPQLQQEVNFQSDIIDSIKENRRLQLKSRLNNIEVSSKSKWFSNSALGGMAASIVVATIGFTYFEYTKFDNNPTLSAQDQVIVTKYVERTSESENIESIKVIESIENNSQNNNSNTETNIEEEENVDLTNVSAPDLAINDSEENEVSNNSLASMDDFEGVKFTKGNGAVNVAVKFEGGRKYAYKFYDEKLFLYGKFNEDKPYEVIEIKTHYGKEFYLNYSNDYYTIKQGKVAKTDLIKIHNSKLIKKLNDLD